MDTILFTNKWLESETKKVNSWAFEIKDNPLFLNTYLNCISKWFFEFPETNKQKRKLGQALKSSFSNDHLGAVNELSWWKFWLSRNYDIIPIPTSKYSTPDFLLKLGTNELIFEVTTLNPAENKKTCEINYSKNKSKKRILSKIITDKIKQFKYGSEQKIPVIMVLFNYNEWTGYGIKQNEIIPNNILQKELSAIIYVEKKIYEGNIYFNKNSFFIAQNKNALHTLPNIFNSTLNSIIENGNCINHKAHILADCGKQTKTSIKSRNT